MNETRVYDVLDEEPAIADHGQSVDIDIQGNIEIDDVTFGYKA